MALCGSPCRLYIRAGEYRENHSVEANDKKHYKSQHNHLEHHSSACLTSTELYFYHDGCVWVPDGIQLLLKRRLVRDKWKLHLSHVLLWTPVQLEDECDKHAHSLHHRSLVRHCLLNLLHVHRCASLRPLSRNCLSKFILLDARHYHEAGLKRKGRAYMAKHFPRRLLLSAKGPKRGEGS